MVLDFLFGKKKKAAAAEQGADAKAKKETIEERIDREMQALPGFIKNKIKDPSIKDKFIALAKRMEKDGVDMNSPKQMKKWVKDHEKELKAEQAGGGKVETVVKGDEPGRNDPCTCGSGQKYKKCCGK